MATGSSRILVDVDEIAVTKQQYSAARDDKMRAIQEIDAAIKSLSGSWEGEAAKAFREQYAKLYKTLIDSDAIMEDAITELQYVIDNTTAEEGIITQASKNLHTGFNYYS